MEPMFELGIQPNVKGARDAAVSLYRQLRGAILEGRLAPGSRLPATRSAASHFGVSRNTAIEVYERLVQDGLATAKHGSGTYVSLDVRLLRKSPVLEENGSEDPRLNGFWRGQDVARAMGYWQMPDDDAATGSRVIDVRPGVVDSRLFPFDRLRQSFTQKLRRMENKPARYNGPLGNQGNFHLRSAIADHVAVTRAVACDAASVLVTSGAQQAFDLIARVIVRPGRTRVAIEDPGYPPMRIPFAAAGAEIVPIPVDEEGMRIDLIPEDVGIVCTCPSHHFPLGVPMSPQRRRDLLAFARAQGAIVIEDDYDGEFRYDGSPVEAMRSSDAADVVFYVGTFSKCMIPSLRLGFLIPPAWALEALVMAKNALDWHASSPLQLGVAGFIADGHLTRHVSRMRKIYGERRAAILEAAEALPGIRVLPSYYGMHLTLVSQDGRNMEDVARRALVEGLQAHGLARYFVDPPTIEGLVVGFGTAEPAELVAAIEIIAKVMLSG